MIAMALACRPSLIIADEPTTALDVMVQAQILDLLAGLVRDLGVGMLIISHDLSVLADICDRVAVMYAGRVVETGPADSVRDPQHPYAAALSRRLPADRRRRGALRARRSGRRPARPARPAGGCSFAPRCPQAARCAWRRSRRCRGATGARPPASGWGSCDDTPGQRRAAHRGRGVWVDFITRAGRVARARRRRPRRWAPARSSRWWGSRAPARPRWPVADGAAAAEEARCAFEGKPLDYSVRALRRFRGQVQMVLQDAAGSLNPRQTIYESVAEGIRLHRRVAADAEGAVRPTWCLDPPRT